MNSNFTNKEFTPIHQQSAPREVVFIEDNINDWEILAQSVRPSMELVRLNSQEDGLAQMADYLKQKTAGSVDAIHVLSHGSRDALNLGSLTLHHDNLNPHRDALTQIGSALTTDGDFLIYGCDVAQDQNGMALIGQLAQLTQADIAASSNLTGKQGDWVLEYVQGTLETSALSSDWQGDLGMNITPVSMAYPGKAAGEWSNYGAFAALKSDGSVVTWGDSRYGGDSSAVASSLSSGVSQIYSTDDAFAALKSDGSVVTWGNSRYGGDSSAVASSLSSGVSQIYSAAYAFAALKNDGSVVTWGFNIGGGDSSMVASSLSSGVSRIYSADYAFAALKNDGSVVTWGDSSFGGDSSTVASSLSSGVSQIYSSSSAFAALKNDGSVVTWGENTQGGDSSAVANSLSSGVSRIYSTGSSFAALKSDGSVVTWGSGYGGDSSAVASSLSSGVSQIYSSSSAFAALKNDGSVVTWGENTQGGDSSAVANSLSSGVSRIYSTSLTFAALKSDGSVVTWGDSSFGGDSSAVANSLSGGVSRIYSTGYAFAALKSDGSVVTWGDSSFGGDSSAVASSLSSGVSKIYTTNSAFAALKSDGSLVIWGHSDYGGNSSAVASSLSSGVVGLADVTTDDRYTYSTGPTVSSIERAASANATVEATTTSIDYTVTFSESVTGVDPSDFKLVTTGTAAGAIAMTSANDNRNVYTVTVNTLSGDGTLRLDLNSSGTGIQSGGSVAIAGGYASGQTYTLDHTAPTTTISNLALASDTGSSSTDFITKTAAQSLTATLSAALAAGEKLYGSTNNGTNWVDISDKVSGTTLTWNGLTLSGSSTFKLKVTDAAGNESVNPVSQNYTYDNTAPTLTSSTPADEGTSVAVGSNIVLNFSEAIAAGTGNIVLHPSTGSDITIAVGDTSQVSISGSTLTLNPTADLSENTTYEVRIVNNSTPPPPRPQNGAQFTPAPTYVLTDVAGNAFGGLSSGALNFTTAAASSGGGGGGGSTSTSSGGTFDGVNVGSTTQADGSTVISVPTVTNDRKDDPTTSNRTHADIPIVKDSQGNAVLTVSVPTGVGLNVEGQGNAITRDSALTDLIKRIEQKTDAGSDIQTKMKGDGQAFLNALTSSDTLIVQTITPTISGTTAPDQPIIINGNTHADGSKDALVIDASKLPSGTKLTLNNVAFAAIVGAVRVTGGEGQNIAVGDNEDQFIVLGADDDILYGGGGTDTVGSLGGNDQTFGEAGNDIVYGGTGNDTLTGGTGSDQYNGGLGTDTAILEGSLKDYTVKIEGQKLILTQISTGDVDTLIDIEKVQFRDDSDSWTIQYQNRATELIGDHLINIQAQRELFGSSGEEQGYLPMGFGRMVDKKEGYDQLNMEGARSDVHLEKNGNAVELTRLKDGAMLSLTNIEAIRFDNGDATLFAHSQTEAILGRLFQTFLNRDGSLSEWKVGTQALKDRVDGSVFAAWFHAQNTALQALKNSDYVQQLYQNTYGRQATNTELSATLSRLDAGSISRDLLAVEVANSSEAITAVGSVMTFEGWV